VPVGVPVGVPAGAPAGAAADDGLAALSGDELYAVAERVYSLLRQEVRFERERRGSVRAW